MDIEKLKAEFEQSECFKKLEHVAQYTFFEFGAYIKRTDVPADIEKKCGKLITALLFSWSAWKEAKAQAVPDTYTPIVLALEDVQSKIAKTSFLTMDEENENEVMAVNANELAAYIDELIEAQEPAND